MKRTLLCLSLLMLLSAALVIAQDTADPDYVIEPYVEANFPVALAFAPDGRLFYTEKHTGLIRVVNADGVTQAEPVISFEISSIAERGLLGITLDPNYTENGYIWTFYTARAGDDGFPSNKVVRFHEADGVGTEPVEMFSAAITTDSALHNGGNLYFDADGYLYVSLGDFFDPAAAQRLDKVQGKIHRFAVVDDALEPAPDNPIEGNSLYAYGFRNPFDFTIDPVTGQVFTTENGPECGDEVNLVLPGENYGWGPDAVCTENGAVAITDSVNPLINYEQPDALTGILIYRHEAFPEWEGDLFYCGFLSGALRRVVLNEDRDAVVSSHALNLGEDVQVRCMVDVAVGWEGGLYFTAPNTIYRLLPTTED